MYLTIELISKISTKDNVVTTGFTNIMTGFANYCHDRQPLLCQVANQPTLGRSKIPKTCSVVLNQMVGRTKPKPTGFGLNLQ